MPDTTEDSTKPTDTEDKASAPAAADDDKVKNDSDDDDEEDDPPLSRLLWKNEAKGEGSCGRCGIKDDANSLKMHACGGF